MLRVYYPLPLQKESDLLWSALLPNLFCHCFWVFFSKSCWFSHILEQRQEVGPEFPTLSIDTTKGFINQWKVNKSYKVVSTLRYHQGTELMLFAHRHPHFSVKKNFLCLAMIGQSKLLSKYFNYLILLLYNWHTFPLEMFAIN